MIFPAKSFAKLRSNKKTRPTPRPQIARKFVAVRSQDAGAAAAVPVVCRKGAGRQQADGSRSDVVVCPVLWIADERADTAISTLMTQLRHWVAKFAVMHNAVFPITAW
jgi:hypothetical protein